MVTYRAAVQGMLTGVLLAVARIAGETAPLLFTALNNQFWSTDLNAPMANLPVVIFQFAMSPYADWQALAWGGALLITAADPAPQHQRPNARLMEQLQAMNSASSLDQARTADSRRRAVAPPEPGRDAACRGAACRRSSGDRPGRRRRPRSISATSTSFTATFKALQEHHAAAARPARDRVHRPVGLRQVDPAAHPEPHLRALSGPGATGEVLVDGDEHPGARARPQPAARQDRHGVPEADAVPDVDLRQHRLRHPALREAAESRARRPRRIGAAPRRAVGRGQGQVARRAASACRAASSSGCASPAPSRSSRRSCCSTSRPRRSTRSRRSASRS